MPALAVRAELIKLGRTLNCQTEELEFLANHSAGDLRALREGLSDAMFKTHASSFKLLAGLSGLLPAPLIAKIAQYALGAFLAGRVTGEMEPDRAVAIARKLPTDFLADVSLSIDPARAQDVIGAMPTKTVQAVARILVQRQEYITMGRFVGAISEDALFRIVDELDDADLLHTGFYVEDSSRLDRIIDHLPDDRLRNVVQTATRQDLWPEALSLVTMLGDEKKGHMGNLVAEEDAAVLDSLVLVAQQQHLWAEVLVAAGSMTEANQRTVANLPSLTQPAVLSQIIATSHEQDMWDTVIPMLAHMSAAHREQAVAAALAQDDPIIKSMIKPLLANAAARERGAAIFSGLSQALREEIRSRSEKLLTSKQMEKLKPILDQ